VERIVQRAANKAAIPSAIQSRGAGFNTRIILRGIATRHDRSSSIRNPPRDSRRDRLRCDETRDSADNPPDVGLTKLTGAGYDANTREKSVPTSLGQRIRAIDDPIIANDGDTRIRPRDTHLEIG